MIWCCLTLRIGKTLLYCKNVGYTYMRLQVFVAWGHQQITIIRCVMINCWSSTKISSFLMWFSLYYLLAEVFDIKIKKFQEVTHCDFNFVIVLVNLLPTKKYQTLVYILKNHYLLFKILYDCKIKVLTVKTTFFM